ncbi:hypothetical protein EG860_15800, partial [Enterococcus faecalis]
YQNNTYGTWCDFLAQYIFVFVGGEAGGRGAAPRASPSRFPLRPAAGARETGAKGGEGRKKSLERGGEVTVVVIVVVIVI